MKKRVYNSLLLLGGSLLNFISLNAQEIAGSWWSQVPVAVNLMTLFIIVTSDQIRQN